MAQDVIALGPGKADLLEQIAGCGSIARAGRELGLSYRRTRDMVDVLNQCWREPLVSTTRGGTEHGGARLTDTGKQVLAAYRTLDAALAEAARDHAPALLALLKGDEPAAD